MRIVVDARFWSETGPGRYIRNLIDQLQKLDQTNEYIILHLNKEYETRTYRGNFTKVLADFRWYGTSEQFKLPILLKSFRPDLVHFPFFNVPVFFNGKFIVTIHDLIHHHFQMKRATTRNPFIYAVKKAGYHQVFSSAVKKSAKIIVPSKFIQKQLEVECRVNPEKIIVTHEGVEETLIQLMQEVGLRDFKQLAGRFSIREPYLFYVGNAHPHKNIPRLIQAFGEIQKFYPKLLLVLAGPDNYFWQEIKDQVKKINLKQVIFTGLITDRELVTLYKHAQAFIMPSLEEGFGIPPLEAMACDCPVVSSNAASLPEVGGNACLYFDPQNVEDMVSKVTEVLSNPNLRRELIERGRERYKGFSWKRLALQTIKAYNNCV